MSKRREGRHKTWTAIILWAVLLGCTSASLGGDDKPRPATDASFDELIAWLEKKYLEDEDVDPSDPVLQALTWRPAKKVELEILADPEQSGHPDPQFTPQPLPSPIPERDEAKTVPPEVLDDYYQRVVRVAKEPTYAVITQELVFQLRSRPKFCADFVRFDVDLEQLSQVQLEILGNWARGGHNRIMLMGDEVGKYADFLGAKRAFFNSDNDRRPRAVVPSCGDEIGIDSVRVAIPFDWREILLSRNFYWEGITASQSPDTEVLAYYRDETNMRVLSEEQEKDEIPRDRFVAAYGRFKCGKGEVYFRPFYLAEGPDGTRLELNWMMWLLGMPITGPASPEVPSAVIAHQFRSDTDVHDGPCDLTEYVQPDQQRTEKPETITLSAAEAAGQDNLPVIDDAQPPCGDRVENCKGHKDVPDLADVLDHTDQPDWDTPAAEAGPAPQYKGQDELPDFSDVLDHMDQPDWDAPAQTDAQPEQDAQTAS